MSASPSYDDLSKSLGLLAAQKIKLEEEVASLREAAQRRSDWIWRMKDRLGYDQNISFDRVMDDLIAGKHIESREGQSDGG